MKRFRFIAVILSATCFLSACAALPHQSADGQSTLTQTSKSADALAEEYTTEVPPDDNSLEITFRVEALQTEEAPLCNGEHGIDRAFEYDRMHCALYQHPDSSDWFLCITLDGISYDMGLVGNLNTDIDRLIGSLIEKTSISQESAVYRLQREESFHVITTTYFAVDNALVPLYTVPSSGMQYDIDRDGQEETVANGGASTMPNYLLYEWEIADGQVRIADLKAQLSCDTLVLDDTQLCFIAGTKADGKWQDTVYEYRGTQLREKQAAAVSADIPLSVEDLLAVLETLDLTEAALVSRTETEETYPAGSAIRAESYLETLKGFFWKEYTLPEEWDEADGYYCRISAGDITITAFEYGYRGDRPLHLVTEAGEGWFILPYIEGTSNESAVQLRQMAYETFLSWYAEAETAAQCGRGGTPLTAEELDAFAEYTASDHTEYVEEHGGYYSTSATEISCFFTSLYNDPRDMDAGEFLWYCPDRGTLEAGDEAEWELVQKRLQWSVGEDGHLASLNEMPVPCRRLPRAYINEILTKYAGITVEEMHTDWFTEVVYIPETDCFYTFSSDYGPGVFRPYHGEKDGDIVTLWTGLHEYSDSVRMLRLQKSEDGWKILSHTSVESQA